MQKRFQDLGLENPYEGGCRPLTVPSARLPLPWRSSQYCSPTEGFMGGVERGNTLSVGGLGTKRFRANLCLLSFRKKVGAVWSA